MPQSMGKFATQNKPTRAKANSLQRTGRFLRSSTGFPRRVRPLIDHLLTLFSIPCLLCGQSQRQAASICIDCTRDLPWLPKGCPNCAIPWPLHQKTRCGAIHLAFDECRAAFAYEFPVQALIVSFKDFEQLHLGRALSVCLAHGPLRSEKKPDRLVPVPSHRQRLRERGFNPAALIAKDLSHQLAIPLSSRLIQKVNATSPQKFRSRAARLHHQSNPFVLNQAVPGEHIAVVDDVVTSMATVHQVSQVLKSGGARRISVWSIARALPRQTPAGQA